MPIQVDYVGSPQQRDPSDFLALKLIPDRAYVDIDFAIPNENGNTIRLAAENAKLVRIHSPVGFVCGAGLSRGIVAAGKRYAPRLWERVERLWVELRGRPSFATMVTTWVVE